jgi:hypothetical protein
MSTSTLNIKQENFYVNFDKLKETEWIPATMRLLTLTHGQTNHTLIEAHAAPSQPSKQRHPANASSPPGSWCSINNISTGNAAHRVWVGVQ